MKTKFFILKCIKNDVDYMQERDFIMNGYMNNGYCCEPKKNNCGCEPKKCYCCEPCNCYCCEPCCKEKKECKKESAQFVSGINVTPPGFGQVISGTWFSNAPQPIDFGETAIADGEKIKLSGNNTVVLQPGRYQIDTHALVANWDPWDPHGSDPIITKLSVNGLPLEYTTNSVDVRDQSEYRFSTQINKANIVVITQPNTTLKWMAGNTVSVDYNFEVYEASIAIIEL